MRSSRRSTCCGATAVEKYTLYATDHASILGFAGVVVYHGPRDDIIPFFASLGFELPERKGAADFLQEITSRKDQKVSAQMTLLSLTRT